LAIRSFDPGSIPGGAAYVPFRRDGYQYVLDNIVMSAGQTVSFTYEMEFEGGEMVTMAIRDENDDSYPDIIVQPVKSCLKARWSYMNHQKR